MPKCPKPKCPCCGKRMRTVVMRCEDCDVEVRGPFRDSAMSMLNADDLAFLEEYLLADFSIKALGERSGMGYAAIRARLDRIVGVCRDQSDIEAKRREILQQLEQGQISASEAAEQIKKL